MAFEIFLIATSVVLIFLYTSWLILVAVPKRSWKPYYPYISVIIPAYNEETNIERTIESVLSCRYPKKFEIVVVDDASTDRTASVVRRLAKKNRNIALLKGRHEGKAMAVNLAMKHAKNDVLVVLDADTLVAEDSLERIVAPFADKTVAAVASTLRVRKSLNPLTWFQHFEYAVSTSWRYAVDKIGGLCIVPGFCAFRAAALRKVGGFKGDTAVEDYDICLHLVKAGYKISMAPAAVAYTKVPETLRGLVLQRTRWNRGTLQTIRKHSDMIGRSVIGLYVMPTQLYWFLHAFMYLPVVLYQIIAGYLKYFVSYGNILSLSVVEYFAKWFTIFGMGDFILKVYAGAYPADVLNTITIAVFVLSYAFALFSILRFSGLNVYSILSLLFFFPYYIIILVVYVFSVVYEAVSADRGEKWEKST